MRWRLTTELSDLGTSLRGTCPPGILLEAQGTHEWDSSSLRSMGLAGERHTGQRWCVNRGSSTDDVQQVLSKAWTH